MDIIRLNRIWTLIVIFLLSVNLYAYDMEIDGIYYNLMSDGTAEVTYDSQSNNTYKGNVVIPEFLTIGNTTYRVVSIGDDAFSKCSYMSSVSIPNSVTSIGEWAFWDCSSLTSITIPNSITTIKYATFYGCSGLKSITIPNSVTKIEREAFSYCRNLTSVIIPNSVKSIGIAAFFDCDALTSITIPNGVTTIEGSAFSGCSSLTSVTIPNSVVSIGTGAFYDTPWDRSLPEGLIYLGSVIYEYKGSMPENTSITIKEGTKGIGGGAFSGCSGLTSVTIPNSVTKIGEWAFFGCTALTSITIPNSVTTIGELAFAQCGLTSITIPNSVKYINESAFSGCSSLTSITIPNSITTIKYATFQGCSGLKSITIPNSVTKIERDAFRECISLKEIISEIKTPFEISWYVFSSNTYSTAKLTIPKGTLSAYLSTNYWNMFSNIVEYGALNTYSLSITVSGGGSLTYSGNTISNAPKSFNVDEGTLATLTFTPDNGYRLSSVKVNGVDVTSSVVNNQYTISSINQNTTVSVTFEAIPPTTYSLSISVSGGGKVTCLGNTVIGGATKSFTVDNGSSATLTLTPNSGYRVKSVVVNGTDVTASVVNNKYTISDINKNTTVSVTFEVIPQTTYTLTVLLTGDGTVSCNDVTVYSSYKFIVNEGTSHTLTITPNSGYRLKSVMVNGTDVTASVVNNQYTVSNISQNTTVIVTYEAIPQYTLNLVASGNGDVKYKSITIRNKSQEWVNIPEGYSLSFELIPDEGYRVASVKENNKDVTSSIVDNLYTVSNIKEDKQLEVLFEVVPPTTYSLSITSSTGGSVAYAGNAISGTTKSYSVNAGTSTTLTFTPNSGYRLKSVVVDGGDVTASVVNNQYTISNIRQNTTVNVTFEEIPPTTYVLSITSSGGGYVLYSGYSIYGTRNFTVNEKTSHTITFTPNSGYRLKSIVINGVDVTANVVNNQYTVSNISQNTTVEVTFVEELKAMTVSGVNYTVTSYDGKTVKVAAGDYGKVLTVPLSFDYDGETWVVYGIESGALANNEKLAAVIWNPFVAFTENPVNPNLLLYVKSASFAPSSVNNVIVNNVAQKITLEESDSENDFYCPLAFTARSITYSHSYQMTTGIDKCQGWETIALPFDVQTISHGTKGVIVPFAAKTGNSQKAFWLYELTNNGWRAASAVKANTPYIISMPNNNLYYDNARLNGRITFSATDVTVPVTNANSVTYQGRTFTANFEHQQKSRSLFTLNVNNEWYSNTSGDEGSQFVAAQRDASPFEAYMTTTNNARTSFGIFEDTSTDIRGIEELIDAKRVNVYNLNGQKRKTAGDESIDELKRRLPAGVYIMNGQKVIVR